MAERPHVTVATVIEKEGQFLLVKEEEQGAVVYNQPAGHVEWNETLQDAALRETLEETGWRVALQSLLGIYQYTSAANGISYVRHCFVAEAIEPVPDARLDSEIIAAEWLTLAEISELESRLRSPMVLRAIDDYRRHVSYPLELIQE